MNIRKCFTVPAHPRPTDLALLLLRVVVGLAFVIHGSVKIQRPFGWMGPDATVPGLLQGLATLAEFGGGLAWILGLLTPLASLGIACTMVFAVQLLAFTLGNPFVSKTGSASFELPAAYFCLAVLLLAGGPGRFSLDRKIFGPR